MPGGFNPFLREAALSRLRAGLAGRRRRLLSLSELLALAEETSGARRLPAARRNLQELVVVLVNERALLPVTSAGLDATEHPAIPARLHNLLAETLGPKDRDQGLHPLLPTPPRSWSHTDSLARLNRWIAEVDSGSRTVDEEPLRRRMLEIFGVEKARPGCKRELALFPAWLGGARAILRLRDYVHPAGSFVTGSSGGTVVMVENSESFSALREVLVEAPVSGLRELVFGSGNALARAFDDSFDRLVYFGDWDLDGLAILCRLARAERRVVPWTAAYRRLLTFAPVECHRPRRRSLDWETVDRLLPRDLAVAARGLAEEPRTIPQEWLGLAELRKLRATIVDSR